jgi:radical SAM protein with 4Fe4S-binding SPASM domain
LPVRASLDITYRCNNQCRHCWVSVPRIETGQDEELCLSEWTAIIDQARAYGTREWAISGGEPMLHPDFEPLYEYVTDKAVHCSLNSNGTLITPRLARLLRKPGAKMIALYGADAVVHDHITRTEGSFEAALRGMAYLREAGADYIVQVVPMADNYHQLKEMISLAYDLNSQVRIGAAWLYLSARNNAEQNREISQQRLDATDILRIDAPSFAYDPVGNSCQGVGKNHGSFASCIEDGNQFHVDPCGRMSFCSFIKDPRLSVNLKEKSFQEAWEQSLPAMLHADFTSDAGRDCQACDLQAECNWCPAYAFLENRRYDRPIDYLCGLAAERKAMHVRWLTNHQRYMQIAGMSIRLDSDLPIQDSTFIPNMQPFEMTETASPSMVISHHLGIPEIRKAHSWKKVWDRQDLTVFRNAHCWVYQAQDRLSPDVPLTQFTTIANSDHSQVRVYMSSDAFWRKGSLESLSVFPCDQALFARFLANHGGMIVHASGLVLNGHGILFVGRSGAGKSTMASLLRNHAAILSDERNVIREQEDGLYLYGTWIHSSVASVSPGPAPLAAVFFIHQHAENHIRLAADMENNRVRLLSCLIQSHSDADWWGSLLPLVNKVVRTVPCYDLFFDKSGGILPVLQAEAEKWS